jgi:hypothetical protein
MAAPTDVRVEAIGIADTDIRWTYPGTGDIGVYRSTDGAAYTLIDTVSNVTLYSDSGLTLATKYWYKLSDDFGSTFSSVVTVWTHSCAGPVSDGASTTNLPPFLGDDGITAERLNEMERRIEAGLNGVNVASDACAACPVEGAVAVDCSSGCNNWVIVADQDINSVSINWCDQFDGTIDFIVPPGTTVGIGGFPAGFGFSGDEAHKAKLSGGSTGRRMGLSFAGGGSGGGQLSPGGSRSSPQTNNTKSKGGSGCNCSPRAGALTIKSCTANNSLTCETTKSLKLIACGGRAPYTWSKTGSVELSASTGARTTVTPTANGGSTVPGTAYSKFICGFSEAHSGGTTHSSGGTWATYNCDDSFNACTGVSPGTTNNETLAYFSNTQSCRIHAGHALTPCIALSSVTCGVIAATGTECATARAKGAVNDHRSGGMIGSGCAPCGIAAAGATVTVEDALGQQATIALRP